MWPSSPAPDRLAVQAAFHDTTARRAVDVPTTRYEQEERVHERPTTDAETTDAVGRSN